MKKEKKLLEKQVIFDNQRPVTILDGDIIRQNLSKGLGFSKEDREENILRVGYVAFQIANASELAICSLIAPYRRTRDTVREIVNKVGGFVEIFVSTPIEECEKRDRKGLYVKARRGEIKNFTGFYMFGSTDIPM